MNQNVFITIKIRFFSNLNCWFKIKIWIDPNCNQTCSLTKSIKDSNNTWKSIKNDNVLSNEGTISNIYPKKQVLLQLQSHHTWSKRKTKYCFSFQQDYEVTMFLHYKTFRFSRNSYFFILFISSRQWIIESKHKQYVDLFNFFFSIIILNWLNVVAL